MSTTLKTKIELMIGEEEAAEFFALFGRSLSAGVLEEGGVHLPLESFRNLTIGLKRAPGGFMVKVKVKYEAVEGEEDDPLEDAGVIADATEAVRDDLDAAIRESEDEDEPARSAKGGARPGYKRLKKRMDKDFKALVKAAEAGAVPAAGQVAPFVADSRLMCTYPGKGDEFYSAFLAAVDAFEAAVASSDAAAFAEAVGGLARLKKDCHAKYK